MTGLNVDKDRRILVALSGGVDSSVAAALLKKEGYLVEGAYMRCWSEGPYCSADADEADATRVAAKLDIPFHVFDFEKEYKAKVIDYFFAEYAAGRTPNPDVICNKEIKFGLLLNKAKELGFDFVATGHYARVSHQASDVRFQKNKTENGDGRSNTGRFELLTGVDPDKDQSYFLYLVGQDQLKHVLFPLGDLTKKRVRELAEKFDLPTAKKPDSTGICFVGPVNVREFLAEKIHGKIGDIVGIDGKKLGRHIGLPFYTIGQREGLGIASSVPYYVADKKVATNSLLVAPFGHEALFKRKFVTQASHWVSGKEPKLPKKLEVKLRYRAKNSLATVKKLADDKLEVDLDEVERAITPGQSAVFYEREKIVGGAVIDKVI